MFLFHRITGGWRWESTSGGHCLPPPARAGSPGPRPGSFWVSPRLEIPHPKESWSCQTFNCHLKQIKIRQTRISDSDQIGCADISNCGEYKPWSLFFSPVFFSQDSLGSLFFLLFFFASCLQTYKINSNISYTKEDLIWFHTIHKNICLKICFFTKYFICLLKWNIETVKIRI